MMTGRPPGCGHLALGANNIALPARLKETLDESRVRTQR